MGWYVWKFNKASKDTSMEKIKNDNQTILNITLLANKKIANNFEHFNISIKEIKSIINKKPTKADKHIYISYTIFQFNNGLNWIFGIDKKL